MSFKVYMIVDPRDHKPFYVGQTGNLIGRIESHMLCHGKGRCVDKIKEILIDGRAPSFVLLEECEKRADIKEAELEWIGHLEHRGAKLFNVIKKENRGNDGKKWSEDEESALLLMMDENLPIKAMAKKLKRSAGAIRSRIHILLGTIEFEDYLKSLKKR